MFSIIFPGQGSQIVGMASELYKNFNYVRDYFKNKRHNMKFYKNSEIVHFYSYYIGNFPSLTEKKIKSICKILNDVN